MKEQEEKKATAIPRWMLMLGMYIAVGGSLWAAAHNQFSEATYDLLWAGIFYAGLMPNKRE